MVTQITRGIKISVKTSFEGTYFKNHKIHFAFSYEITIENYSKDSVQLTSRHWEIFDSLNCLLKYKITHYIINRKKSRFPAP